MLSVYFGYDRNAIMDIDTYFNNTFSPEWFNNSMVKQMVKDIDNSEVLSEYCIQSEVLGQIPPVMLSGGVKVCITLLMSSEQPIIDLIACGSNCEEWLLKIFDIKDVRVSMSGCDLLFRNLPIHGICENDNSEIRNWLDWRDKMIMMAGEPENER